MFKEVMEFRLVVSPQILEILTVNYKELPQKGCLEFEVLIGKRGIAHPQRYLRSIRKYS